MIIMFDVSEVASELSEAAFSLCKNEKYRERRIVKCSTIILRKK